MRALSILMPGRNEMWQKRTIDDVLKNIQADTEIIAVMDGELSTEPIPQHPRVKIINLPVSIGQRAATNLAARASRAKYVMKLDAHCAVSDGFDLELIKTAALLGPKTTQIPRQYNLHVFDWICDGCGERTYQGPTKEKCDKCGGVPHHRDIVWNAKRRRNDFFRLDKELHFQYWGRFEERPEAKGDIVDIMTSLGACFFMERERFWEIGGLDEEHGSWGQFGAEIALKSWLSGGRHVVNKRCWFSHLFRTQGGDFGFPYPQDPHKQEAARAYSRQMWRNNEWEGQVLPFRWLLEKFWPVPEWTEADLNGLPSALKSGVVPIAPRKVVSDAQVVPQPRPRSDPAPQRTDAGIVYYSDNRAPRDILGAVRRQIVAASPGLARVRVVLDRQFEEVEGFETVVLGLERGYLTMFKQILIGLQLLDTKYAFLSEHDVLYDASHYLFRPERDDLYYYNTNVWHVSAETGQAITYTAKRTSQLCANRELLIEHYRKRVARVAAEGFTRRMGFEPGSHNRKERVDDFKSEVWRSDIPSVDIKHGLNLTPARWRQDQFRDQRNCRDWAEADEIPGWGKTKGCFPCFLNKLP